MTIDEIKKLIDVLRDTGISELEVHWGDNWVRVRNGLPGGQELPGPALLSGSISSSPGNALSGGLSQTPSEVSGSPALPAGKEDDANLLVKSPIVGTYYDSPAPGEASFVKIGDRVEPKQVLCIIESMKLMNEIEAEVAGTVVSKHVENGRPVEYGEALFTVRPL